MLSTGLDKNSFGQINLVLAILLTVLNILSFGMEPVVVRKIASTDSAPGTLLSVYLFHVVLSGIVFYAVLLLLNDILPQAMVSYRLLLLIGIGKLMIFFSTPFKQFAAGFERFKLLSAMLVVSNILRGLALLLLAWLHHVTLNNVVAIFILGDVAELVVSVILFKRKLKIPLVISWNKKQYFQLVKESLPQVGVVIFSSALARFDWIFIGTMVSAAKLAEYSFAYKVIEMSTLPLLALAPLLVPWFTRLIKSGHIPVASLQLLVRMEMIVAALISLLLCLCWAPLMDWITHYKYGEVNSKTIFILSLGMPVLYLNNFLWSISFAQGKLKMIFRVMMICVIVNLAGDILLIPFFKNEGAALAYLVAMLVQCGLFIKLNDVEGLRRVWVPLLSSTLCALASGFIAVLLFTDTGLILLSATGIYFIALFITRQLRISDYRSITGLFR